MSQRLEAHYDDRIYYFFVKDYVPGRAIIEMYKAGYTFVQQDNKWVNDISNPLQMVDGLIAAVMHTIQLQP